MRRFLLVAVAWLGLLGIAEPLLACAMNTPASACCPHGIQTPCDHDTAQAPPAVASPCCIPAPVGKPLAIWVHKADASHPHHASGNPDVLAITAPSLYEALAPVGHFSKRLRISDSFQQFGADTYLRTGRLRL